MRICAVAVPGKGYNALAGRTAEFAIRTDVELYTAMPSGWRKITGSMTAPRGSTWIYNGKSYFSGERKTALLVEKECLK